jgi:hypothetical protein
VSSPLQNYLQFGRPDPLPLGKLRFSANFRKLPIIGLQDASPCSSAIMPVVAEFESLSEQLARTTAECERLREENVRLRKLLALGEGDGEPAGPTGGTGSVVALTPVLLPRPEPSVADKIALFRSLFRGRDDIYAVHWEGADGKSG